MDAIKQKQQRVMDARKIVNRGNEGKIQTGRSILYLPKKFDGHCLPVSIILGATIELGHHLDKWNYRGKSKDLLKINSLSPKLKEKACRALSDEYEKVKRRISNWNSIKLHTFPEICPILQDYYNINILIHSNINEEDKIIYSVPRKYNCSLPRVDILWNHTLQGENLFTTHFRSQLMLKI